MPWYLIFSQHFEFVHGKGTDLVLDPEPLAIEWLEGSPRERIREARERLSFLGKALGPDQGVALVRISADLKNKVKTAEERSGCTLPEAWARVSSRLQEKREPEWLQEV